MSVFVTRLIADNISNKYFGRPLNIDNYTIGSISNFKIMDDYTEKKILVKNNKRGANYVSKIILTPDCFKELCMLLKTDRSK